MLASCLPVTQSSKVESVSISWGLKGYSGLKLFDGEWVNQASVWKQLEDTTDGQKEEKYASAIKAPQTSQKGSGLVQNWNRGYEMLLEFWVKMLGKTWGTATVILVL